MRDRLKILSVLILFSFISIRIFWEFFFKGLHPFPGNFLLAWFEPWKTDHNVNGVITIIHKPIASDTFRQLYPFKELAMSLIKKMQLPLWNPYNGAGMPLFATANIGFLDPLNIFFLFTSGPFAWTLSIILQPIFIGFFCYLFCKKIKLSTSAAIFTSIIFIFSGSVVTRLVYNIFGTAFASLPLLLYLAESYIQDNKTKKIFIIPFIIFSLIVSTQPQISFYIFAFLIAYILTRTRSYKSLLLLFIFILLGIGLAAIQLFPTAELYRYSNFSTYSSKFIFERFLMPLEHYLTLFIPNYFGSDSTYNYWGAADYIETALYMGLIPILFALFGMYKKPKNTFDLRFFLIGVIGICLVTTIKTPVSEFIFSLPIPLLSTGIPTRIFILSTFSFAVLSGLGFDIFLQAIKKKNLIFLIILYTIFVLGILGVTALIYINHIPCRNFLLKTCRIVSLRNTLLETFSFGAFLLITIIYIFRGKKMMLIYKILVISIIFFIGIYNTEKFLPYSSIDTFMPANKLITELQKLHDGRIYGIGEANISTDFATLFKFYDPNYYHPLYIKRYGELIAFGNTDKQKYNLLRSDVEIVKDATISANLEFKRNRLFNLLGVKYLIYKKSEIENKNQPMIWEDNNWYISQNKNSLPRAYLTTDYLVIKNSGKILKKLFDPTFDLSKKVIIEDNPNFISSENNIAKTSIVSYHENDLTIKAQTEHTALLTISDNYYPGWRALIDGKKTKIYRTNYTFRSVVVPPGKHTIIFLYNPASVTEGEIITIISFFIIVLLILRGNHIFPKFVIR